MKYNFQEIENKWQRRWLEDKTYEPDLDGDLPTLRPIRYTQGRPEGLEGRQAQGKKAPPFYNLMMFPYPSAEGLHVGNMYAFTGSDIYGRFKRMQGYDVFEPIGLDGFGIHSENYAIRAGKHPSETTKEAQKNFYRQLQEIGNSFAWDEKLETYDPAYYKWTQWIFVQMFKHGLAYRKKQSVNWCPSCKTVLADEQVVHANRSLGEGWGGECERCLTKVEKRELEQWFFKITDYAERLLNDLENLDWPEKIKIAQRNWIGKSEGVLIKFDVRGRKFEVAFNIQHPTSDFTIEVFTTRPDTIFGATFIAISPELAKQWIAIGWQADEKVKKYVEKILAERAKAKDAADTEKTGIDAGLKAVNPATKEEIPVWVVNYVLGDVGTGAIMAVPAHDERDFEFAKKYKLPVKIVICPHYPETTCPILDTAYTGKGHLVDSGKFSGMPSDEAAKKIVDFVKGKPMAQYHLRDWLISRQRYWGPPIPMVYCETCAGAGKGERKDMPGWYSVSEKDLPVELPFVTDFRPKGTGVSPLASVKEFYEVKCPACGKTARRETDVSDTFLDSAWYYLRYLDPKNGKEPWNKSRVKHWLPIGMYIGGAEHAVLHLLYFRFIAKAFHDWGLIHFDEPAKKFRAHGLLIRGGKKISKSKRNIVNPDDFIEKFGADALRLHLMFLGPFEEGGDFSDAGIAGPARFLDRIWKFVTEFVDQSELKRSTLQRSMIDLELNKAIKKVAEDIEKLHYNTAISALMILLRILEHTRNSLKKSDLEVLIKLLSLFAPYIAHELWDRMGNRTVLSREKFPKLDEDKLAEKHNVTIVIQVNGKTRAIIAVSTDITEERVRELALNLEPIKKFIGGAKPKKVIFVPNRLINFVI